MDDLDFDELHQQVSKLMEQASKPKSARKMPNKDEEKVAVKSSDSKPAPRPAAPAKISDDSKIIVKRPAPQIVPPRRRGVAMDIVQPRPPAAAPSEHASRTGATLQPTRSVTPEPLPKPASERASTDVGEDTLASLNMQTDIPPKSAASDVHKNVMPDPLDVHGFKMDEPKSDNPPPIAAMQHSSQTIEPPKPEPNEQTAQAEEEDSSKPEPEVQEGVAPSMSQEHNPPEPSTTPFVNAKVEKRPLGAFAGVATESQTEPDHPGTEQLAESEKAPTINMPSAPKELSPEVVAVESAESETIGRPADMNELRQMSIPKQYQEQTKDPSHDTRPVFDTKTYHPPIEPTNSPKKSHKNLISVIILIVLLAVAAGLAYFMLTGSLNLSQYL